MSQESDAVALPVGTTGARPTGSNLTNGEIRYNTSTPGLEAYVIGTPFLTVYNGTEFLSTQNGGTMSYYANTGGTTPYAAIEFQEAGGTSSSAGYISVSTTSTAYNTSSDRRLKENISPSIHGLDLLMKIPVTDYNHKNDPSNRIQGFIAQDLYEVYPEAVTVGGDNPKTKPWAVDYGRITPLLVRAIQEQQAQLTKDEAALAKDEATIAAMKAKLGM